MDPRSIPFFIVLLIFFTHAYDAGQEKCENIRRLKHSPGMGWDSLQSKQMGAILSRKYNNCHTTDDKQFEIPNDLEATSIKKRITEVDPITDWLKYNPMTAKTLKLDSIKADEFSKIDGFFTQDYVQIKKHRLDKNYATVRIMLRYFVYKLMTSSRTVEELDAQFKEKLEQIGGEINLGRTKSAKYLADTVVRDYGTHLIRSIDVGGIFGRDDYFSVNYVKKNLSILMDIAQVSFFNSIGLSGQDLLRISQSNLSSYESLKRDSKMFTVGGVEFKKELTLEEWESGLYNNLVVIDQSGVRLDLALRQMQLNLRCSDPGKTIDLVQNAVEKYYRVNIHKGCIAAKQPFLDTTVNFDAGEICDQGPRAFDIPVHPNFGGVYSDLIENIITKSRSCPPGFDSLRIVDLERVLGLETDVTDQIFVCIDNKNVSRSCPPGFDPLRKWRLETDQNFVCITNTNLEEVEGSALLFGGLYKGFDKCPNSSWAGVGQTQHFITFSNELEIYYCSRIISKDVKYEVALLRPPYSKIEDEVIVTIEIDILWIALPLLLFLGLRGWVL
uniref:MACPF domain-containing protein n=1 Tax=Strigamia maritima TaxID=126957 RepID=T1JGB9_STRMM